MIDILKNPFVIIGDIPEPYFCDREAETQKIIRTITNEGNIVLVSPRRMGKSRLVKHIFKQPEISEHYQTFYIDLLHTSSIREFAYTFGKTVLPTFTLEMGRIQSPEYTIQEVMGWLEESKTPCIVCFDEFQRINKYPDNKQGQVEAMLRGIIQHLRNVNFIFAGSEQHLLSEMFFSSAKPFYNSADQLNLNPLKIDVYTDFVRSWMEQYKKSIDIDAFRFYYEKFEGTTYYLQKLMHEAFIDCDAGAVCDKTLLDKTYIRMLEEARESASKLLGTLTEHQKSALYAIAREGKAERVLSAAFIKRHALVSTSSMQSAIKKLIEMELISMRNNTYSLTDIMMRLYITEGMD